MSDLKSPTDSPEAHRSENKGSSGESLVTKMDQPRQEKELSTYNADSDQSYYNFLVSKARCLSMNEVAEDKRHIDRPSSLQVSEYLSAETTRSIAMSDSHMDKKNVEGTLGASRMVGCRSPFCTGPGNSGFDYFDEGFPSSLSPHSSITSSDSYSDLYTTIDERPKEKAAFGVKLLISTPNEAKNPLHTVDEITVNTVSVKSDGNTSTMSNVRRLYPDILSRMSNQSSGTTLQTAMSNLGCREELDSTQVTTISETDRLSFPSSNENIFNDYLASSGIVQDIFLPNMSSLGSSASLDSDNKKCPGRLAYFKRLSSQRFSEIADAEQKSQKSMSSDISQLQDKLKESDISIKRVDSPVSLAENKEKKSSKDQIIQLEDVATELLCIPKETDEAPSPPMRNAISNDYVRFYLPRSLPSKVSMRNKSCQTSEVKPQDPTTTQQGEATKKKKNKVVRFLRSVRKRIRRKKK